MVAVNGLCMHFVLIFLADCYIFLPMIFKKNIITDWGLGYPVLTNLSVVRLAAILF